MYDVLNYVSPIPFYKSKEEIDRRNDYAFGETYHNIMFQEGSTLHVPSFLVHTTIPANLAVSASAVLRSEGDTTSPVQLPSASFTVIQDSGYATVVFTESDVSAIPKGECFIELYVTLTGGTEVFYSDTLFITDFIRNYVKLSWHNEVDLEIAGRKIPFTDGFRPSCYVDSHIGKPEYRYEEESTSRVGYEFIESVLSKKTYRFVFLLPEYLCDAMRLAKLCHVKRITRYDAPNYGREYRPMNMTFDVEWEEQGNLAGVTCTFDIDNVISNTSGFMPGNGDFNNDYSNDFNNF